jgi:hypothetical protein
LSEASAPRSAQPAGHNGANLPPMVEATIAQLLAQIPQVNPPGSNQYPLELCHVDYYGVKHEPVGKDECDPTPWLAATCCSWFGCLGNENYPAQRLQCCITRASPSICGILLFAVGVPFGVSLLVNYSAAVGLPILLISSLGGGGLAAWGLVFSGLNSRT